MSPQSPQLSHPPFGQRGPQPPQQHQHYGGTSYQPERDPEEDQEDHLAQARMTEAEARWQASTWNVHQGNGNNEKVKCVFIGDGAVGKTSLIVSYTTNGYPSEYVPTAIDTYDVVVHVDGEPVTFEMCDTPGQDDFDTLRPLCYPHTDVFLVCFSVVSPSSFQNVREKWIPELKKSHGPNTSRKDIPPIVLVGTQSDLREDVKTLVSLAEHKEQPITEQEARRLANQIGCETYIESSSLTQKNLKEVFDEAIVAGLKGRRKKEKKLAKKKRRAQQNSQSGCMGNNKTTCTII